ncbi:MAG: hypothetical protein RIR17_1333 [Planctomycetota bacterium]|jgi:small subunit ribosomal protein S20
MPHTRSAKKNMRKSEKRRLQNRAKLREIKLQVKNLQSLENASKEELQKEYNLAAKKLDKAGAKNVIHPNKAARIKRQLAKLLNKPAAKK